MSDIGNLQEKYSNPMERQVFSLPTLIPSQYDDLEPKARTVLSFQEIFNIQRVVLTGCGDSYGACLATKHVFEMLTGIQAEVVTALDLGRYYGERFLGVDCQNPLVIAVSNSGSVARVTEAVKRARLHGCFVLGITGNTEAPLAQSSDKVLKLDIPSYESAPGTRSYMVSVMAILLLAVRIGEVRGRYTMDQAMDYRYDMRNQGKLLEELLPRMAKECAALAFNWKELSCFDFVGAGFDYAAAWFGQAKMLEATGKFSMHINSEEWFHLNCFAKNPEQIGTVIVANTTNPGLGRTKDVIRYARELGRPMLVVTDGGGDVPGGEDEGGVRVTGGEDERCIRVPSPKYPMNMPLTQFVPMCLLSGYISAMLGEAYGRGCEGPWRFCENGRCVRENEIIVS